jgi:hypothetical protein
MKSDTSISARPEAGEYAAYYNTYVSLVPERDILITLDSQSTETVALLSGRKPAEADFRYAPGKWSVKEVLGHVIDSERIFAYRALRIARNDKTPMEGFEQDDYVKNGHFGQANLDALVEEFKSVRQATRSLFRNLDGAAWMRRGLANKNEVSVRALAYIIAGHELHHQRILREKYFRQVPVEI